MNTFELLVGADPAVTSSTVIEQWTTPAASSFATDLDPWLTEFGDTHPAATDLVRIAVAAFLADQRFRRPASWARTIELAVHLADPAPLRRCLDHIETLLYWLTGDDWRLTLHQSTTSSPGATTQLIPTARRVSLLSGGLDSACGASLLDPAEVIFLGHADNTAVRHAQSQVRDKLTSILGATVDARFVTLKPAAAKTRKEHSTRTRSLLFMTLAAALATAVDASEVLVPENGFTSLNPPLGYDRGGPYTTRSTHPTTFEYLNAILRDLGVRVRLTNPHADRTKGELVQLAVNKHGHQEVEQLAAVTLSCAKLGGQFLAGDPNLGCGVCVACMTRRGSVIAALGNDPTRYNRDILKAKSGNGPKEFAAWQKFESRHADIDAVRAHDGWNPNVFKLVPMGPFPDGFDYVRAADLLQRGMRELVSGIPN